MVGVRDDTPGLAPGGPLAVCLGDYIQKEIDMEVKLEGGAGPLDPRFLDHTQGSQEPA